MKHSPLPKDRQRLIKKSEGQLQKSDESAFSIIPSHMSSRLSVSTRQTESSGNLTTEKDMVYHHLSFENDLFTSRVYKRNYRNPRIQQLFDGKGRECCTNPTPSDVLQTLLNQIPRYGPPNYKELLIQKSVESGVSLDFEPSRTSQDDTVSENAETRDKASMYPQMTVMPSHNKELRPNSNLADNDDDSDTQKVVSSSKDDLKYPLLPNSDSNQGKPAASRGSQVTGKVAVIPKGIEKCLLDEPRRDSNIKPSPGLWPETREGFLTVPFCDAVKWRSIADTGSGVIRESRSFLPPFHNDLPPANVRDKTGRSLTSNYCSQIFVKACARGDYTRVKELLKSGHNIHAQNAFPAHPGVRAIHAAAYFGHSAIVQLLLQNGASTEDRTLSTNSTPLHLATHLAKIRVMGLLLEYGAEIAARNRKGEQPVHLASASGQTEALTVLLESGATLDSSNDLGHFPLHCALEGSDRPEVIEFLIRKGADLHKQTANFSQERPLEMASRRDRHRSVRILLDCGAGVRYQQLESSIHIAITRGSQSCLEELVRHNSTYHGLDLLWFKAIKWLLWHPLPSQGIRSADPTVLALLIEYDYRSAGSDSTLSQGFLPAMWLVSVSKKLSIPSPPAENIDTLNEQGVSSLYEAIWQGKRRLSLALFNAGARLLSHKHGYTLDLQVREGANSGEQCFMLSMKFDTIWPGQRRVNYQGHDKMLDAIRALGWDCVSRRV